MISGHDTVFLVSGNLASTLRGFLDGLHVDWPEMQVAISGGSGDGQFRPWAGVGLELPDNGDILIARDFEMSRAWDDEGYVLTDGSEGPIAIFYTTGPSSLRVQLLEDPYLRKEYEFRPYEAILAGAGFGLVTVVTPSLRRLSPSGLSRR